MLTMKKLRRMKPPGVSLKAWARSQGEKAFPVIGGESDREATPKVYRLLGVIPSVRALDKMEQERKQQKARRERSKLLHSMTVAARRKRSQKTQGKSKKVVEEKKAA